MAVVVLDRVSKTWPGGVRAVDDVSLDIADGELLVLVGPSGCGKTTTLRMIAGLETPTAGEIRIGDRVVNRVHPRDRDVAMVFQDYALYPHMTVRKNLSFALRLRKTPRAEIAERVAATATLLGIEELLERRPAQLSGGQQQRVALGRAIVRRPACFLFDEPLSNLDARRRLSMRAELKALHRRLGATIVHVTHDQEEAMSLGDRLVVMAEGRVRQVGTPLEVWRRPADRFVAEFVGSPPMNLVAGRVVADGFRRSEAQEERGIDLPAALAQRRAGAEAVLGIRPEHLRRVAEGPWRGRVEVVEPLGDRTDVVVALPGTTRLVARIASEEAPAVGDAIALGAAPAHLHLFEPGLLGARIPDDGA